jgi:quercetin dioxygenase-like cupin family protein
MREPTPAKAPPAASAGGVAQRGARLGSLLLDWAELPVVVTPRGEKRPVCDAATATMRRLGVHVTTLAPGETPHAAHRHPDEEILLVQAGSIEVRAGAAVRRLGPGAFCFFAADELHGLRNPGPEPAVYWVLRIDTAETAREGPATGDSVKKL